MQSVSASYSKHQRGEEEDRRARIAAVAARLSGSVAVPVVVAVVAINIGGPPIMTATLVIDMFLVSICRSISRVGAVVVEVAV